jgi:diadenosine tetraphosphate (Ap4A) HIT family hydrolase
MPVALTENNPVVDDVTGCIPCDALAGRAPLPGGRITETRQWSVMHVFGSFGLGSLAVVPLRHVVHVAGLTDEEVSELGTTLREAAAVVTELTNPVQIYTCQWSHHDGQAAHIHFILQPITQADMDAHPGKLGPMLQVAMSEAGNKPDLPSVEAFSRRARTAYAARHPVNDQSGVLRPPD